MPALKHNGQVKSNRDDKVIKQTQLSQFVSSMEERRDEKVDQKTAARI